MAWSYEVPSADGWYWWQAYPFGMVRQVLLVGYEDGLMVWECPEGGETEARPGDDRGRWVPIPVPNRLDPWPDAQETA